MMCLTRQQHKKKEKNKVKVINAALQGCRLHTRIKNYGGVV